MGTEGRDKKRVAIGGGAAVAIVIGVVTALAVSGGGAGSAAAKGDRPGSQIDTASGTRAGDAIGQPTPEQGNGAGGRAQGGATSDSAGTQGGPGGASGSSVASSTASSHGPNGGPSTGAPPSGTAQQPTGAPPASSSAPANPPAAPAAQAPAYGGRLAAEAAKPSSATTSVTLHTAGASSNADTLLVSVMLTNTHSGGVGASDSAGNSYAVVADQSDGAGDRTLILAAVGAKPLSAGGSVTVTFPATSEHHVALDAVHGVTKLTGHSSATAGSGQFASGSAAASGPSIVFGVAGVQGGTAATWSSGFTALPTLLVAPEDQLAAAYEVVGGGSYQASGSCTHQWMAAVVVLG